MICLKMYLFFCAASLVFYIKGLVPKGPVRGPGHCARFNPSQYLCTPVTNIFSEKLLFKTENIFEVKRNRLNLKIGEKCNLPKQILYDTSSSGIF